MSREFPPRKPGEFYLTEGGTGTEILYKWGYEMPEFAMYPLLDNPEADECILGGCCGTDERHLREIAKIVTSVRSSVPGE